MDKGVNRENGIFHRNGVKIVRYADRRRNRIIETLKNLMREGTRQYEFSATAATVILHEESYAKIKQPFIKNQLWDDELIDLETEVKFCAFNLS